MDTSAGVTAPAAASSDGTQSVAELLNLPPLEGTPTDANEPQPLGEFSIDESSPAHCSQVMLRLDELAREGHETVECFTSEPLEGDSEETADEPAALPETWCSNLDRDVWWQTRRGLCVEHRYYHQVIDTQTARPVGRASFLIQQEIRLRDVQATPLTVQEFFAVTLRDQRGEATNMQLQVESGCAGCSRRAESPWDGWASFAEGQTRRDTWNWEIPIASGGLENPNWGWALTSRSRGLVPVNGSYEWGGGIAEARCDNRVGGDYGCIIPNYIPDLLLDYSVEQAAGMLVYVGYQLNNHWWGSAAERRPLTRLADERDAEVNRDIICPISFELDLSVPDPSCDEYPFAATYQSRDNGTIYNGDRCQQLTSLQYDNGDWDLFAIGTWDPNAPCLRATTPLSQNRSVGGELGRFNTRNRLLDRDSYYVLVYDSRL